MAGKISEAERNLKVDNKFNSNMVKISSSKSILPYQNGSALNIENREETADEGMRGAGYQEEIFMPQELFSEDQDQNLKSDCLDLLRKKLISDLSLAVFSTDLENKFAKMEPIEISKERQTVIQKLLVQISQLSDAEKLLLYLKLPCSTSSPFDPLRQPLNPLGNRQEIQQTIVWIKTHLEEDSEISIPKQDVYDQYLKYCENVSMKPLSTADFGKVMKQVYPGVRPRRLGTRGNSRYCYSGMRNTCKLPTPILPHSSTGNVMSNGGASDGTSLLGEANTYKKADRTKKKLKGTLFRGEKCSTFNHNCAEKDLNYNSRNVKRSKMEGKEGIAEDLKGHSFNEEIQKGREDEGRVKEKVDLSGIKCEESSDNSFNAFEIECGLDSDFGIYFKNLEKDVGNSSTSSSGLKCGSPFGGHHEEKQNKIQKMLFSSGNHCSQNSVGQNEKSSSEENMFFQAGSAQNQKPEASCHVRSKMNCSDGLKDCMSDQRKTVKGRSRKSTSLSKPSKNMRKCYVPIQPKPVDMQKFNVCFEQPFGMNQFLSQQKRDLDGPSLCEESDSQEPEEEIIRYFKHLDESELNASNLIDEAAKSIDSNTVQNNGTAQIVSKNAASYRRVDEVLNHASQQILRSQSCFEVQRQLFNLGENIQPVHVPRSQSSVELPTSAEQNHREAVDADSTGASGKNKKISHLRILLEKSICASNKMSYSGLKETSNELFNGNSVVSVNQMVNQTAPKEQTCLLPQVKPISSERDLLKQNGLKILNSGPSYVPQSPNNRTKYFSFTPISPGPQSPLKTPSTPSASPFVSPRGTPVPRSRQNSANDFFLSPLERKSTFRADSEKIEIFSENDLSFSQTLAGNFRMGRNKHTTYPQGCRPRSFSSTNFCRSRTRKNSSKVIGFNQRTKAAPNRVQTTIQNNFLINSQFSIHKNFVSSECLSNEVRKFLKSNSVLPEDQSATIRSQSVPLNRMMSESSWAPSQVSSAYLNYFNSGSSNPALPSVSVKFPEWVSNSETNSPKNLATNASPFLVNGDIPGMDSGPLNSEVFPGDSAMPQLDDQYFTGEFRPGNDEGFSESDPFHENSSFPGKLDLNSTATFDSPFTSESDHAIADNIKSYLPDFEGLESKSLDNAEGLNDRKLLKTSQYERGSDNMKDPVITSFKPVITNEMSSCSASPVLNFFGTKMNEDNQQLIEFFDFED